MEVFYVQKDFSTKRILEDVRGLNAESIGEHRSACNYA